MQYALRVAEEHRSFSQVPSPRAGEGQGEGGA